jgi:ubiquinone/menaquinone biosynthesis C-methylase UbiE
VPVEDGMLVVDIGSGAFPNPRADVLCDRELTDNRHRSGMAAVVDRPFVVADVTALLFRDGSIDFAIVSHLAEHVADPVAMCDELRRVAKAGYIETPSPLAEWLLEE